MGVHQAAALVFDVRPPGRQGADCPIFVALKVLYLLPDVLLHQLAILAAQLDRPVQRVHLLFDDVDQDSAEGAVVGSLAPGTDEVGVEVAFAVACVLHEEAGTTQPVSIPLVSF